MANGYPMVLRTSPEIEREGGLVSIRGFNGVTTPMTKAEAGWLNVPHVPFIFIGKYWYHPEAMG